MKAEALEQMFGDVNLPSRVKPSSPESACAAQAVREMEPEALEQMLGEIDLPSWVNFPDFERVRWVNAGAHLRDKNSSRCVYRPYGCRL